MITVEFSHLFHDLHNPPQARTLTKPPPATVHTQAGIRPSMASLSVSQIIGITHKTRTSFSSFSPSSGYL